MYAANTYFRVTEKSARKSAATEDLRNCDSPVHHKPLKRANTNEVADAYITRGTNGSILVRAGITASVFLRAFSLFFVLFLQFVPFHNATTRNFALIAAHFTYSGFAMPVPLSTTFYSP